MIQYHGKIFRSRENSPNGTVTGETVFYYRQNGHFFWGHYGGGEIVIGTMVGECLSDGRLRFSYQHLLEDGDIQSGLCTSVPEILPDARIRLHESWQWTSGDHSYGTSVVEEEI